MARSADSHLRVCPGLPVQCTHVLWSLYTLSAYLFNLFTLLFTKYNSSLQLPVLRSFLRFLGVIFTQNLIPFSLSSSFKNNLNLRLTWLERMQRYMSGVCAHSSIYIVTYFIFGQETRHIPLHLLQLWQVQILTFYTEIQINLGGAC